MKRIAESKLVFFIGCSLALSSAQVRSADDYPKHPIRLIVPYQPGGSTDFASRAVQQGIARLSGMQLIIDNRPGAGTALGTELAAGSAPDGYTLLLCSTPFSILPTLRAKLPYSPSKDFAAVTQISSQPYVIVVAPRFLITNLSGFLTAAKAKLGGLTYGSAGPGSGSHVAVEALVMQTGIRMVHVPYKGTGPALVALLGNEVDVVLAGVVSAMSHQKSGKLRALAVMSPRRAPSMASVPTVAESGLILDETASWNGILVPAGTPSHITTQLNLAIVAAIRTPAMRSLFENAGAEVVGSSSAEFELFIKSEIAKWAKVIRFAQIRVE